MESVIRYVLKSRVGAVPRHCAAALRAEHPRLEQSLSLYDGGSD